MIVKPKGYQSAAKDNVLEIFRYANAQLDGASDRTAVGLPAPTTAVY